MALMEKFWATVGTYREILMLCHRDRGQAHGRESGISAAGRGRSESQAAVVAMVRLFQIIQVHVQSPRARTNMMQLPRELQETQGIE